jgi:myo-inositol 2-dehydrogenase/D-chiro-inositol 1-dehydrogenase
MIAGSTDTHANLVEAAARAGQAVFCEKPLDLLGPCHPDAATPVSTLASTVPRLALR